MRDQTPSEGPAPELDDRHVEPLEALERLLGLQSPLRIAQAASEPVGRPFCGQCGGRIEWISEDEDWPYWRHLDLADLDEPHGAYRDELAAPPEGP